MTFSIDGIVPALAAIVPPGAASNSISGLTDLLPPSTGIASGAAQPGFGQLIADGLREVNRQLAAGQTALQQLALGDAQNLHQVMLKLEESRLSFQLMMQVRNRLLEAYQDVMKMPV